MVMWDSFMFDKFIYSFPEKDVSVIHPEHFAVDCERGNQSNTLTVHLFQKMISPTRLSNKFVNELIGSNRFFAYLHLHGTLNTC